mmetsp:Transcript_5747/g.17612  ORF Transcript_5747/g.17612 Transcript_5747/m.17612 type:complete len:269 (-) Transcript_5747:135-941(-)
MLTSHLEQFADTTSSNVLLLTTGEDTVVLSNLSDHTLLIGVLEHILNIEQRRDAQLIFGHRESQLEVVLRIIGTQRVVIDEMRFVHVDESTEGQTIGKAAGKVLDVHIVVGLGLTLAPQQQSFLGSQLTFADVGNDKLLDDGPNKTQRELEVSVDKIVGTNVLQTNSFALHKADDQVHVRHLLNAHTRFLLMTTQVLVREDLQQLNEQQTTAQIHLKVIDVQLALLQMHVAPLGESLLLDTNPRLIRQHVSSTEILSLVIALSISHAC